MHVNEVSGEVIRAAMRVHSELGPGLLESAYRVCLAHELRHRGLEVRVECALPIEYGGLQVDAGYRLDLLVEDTVIVELKTVHRVLPVHRAQLLSYLKLSGRQVGLLINFNVTRLALGLVRIVNNAPLHDGRLPTHWLNESP